METQMKKKEVEDTKDVAAVVPFTIGDPIDEPPVSAVGRNTGSKYDPILVAADNADGKWVPVSMPNGKEAYGAAAFVKAKRNGGKYEAKIRGLVVYVHVRPVAGGAEQL